MQGYANWGGMAKELGCQIVTQKLGSDAGLSTTQIGVEWSIFHRLFTARFLFRKLLHFGENNLYQFFRIVSPKVQFDLPRPFK